MAKKAKKARASQQSGFTLIELLAVITIMGILMMVAIPAISRTIENSRRDTFMNTAKSYAAAIQNSVASDEISCYETNASTSQSPISGLAAGANKDSAKYYAYYFKSDAPSGTDLMESGGKSSWASKEVTGYVLIEKYTTPISGSTQTTTHYNYYVSMTDGTHGIQSPVEVSSLKRSHVIVSGANLINAEAATAKTVSLNSKTAGLCIIG